MLTFCAGLQPERRPTVGQIHDCIERSDSMVVALSDRFLSRCPGRLLPPPPSVPSTPNRPHQVIGGSEGQHYQKQRSG